MYETKSSNPKSTLFILKREAHRLCDIIWGGLDSGYGDRKGMYNFIQQHTYTGHIATSNERELRYLIKKLNHFLNKYGVQY